MTFEIRLLVAFLFVVGTTATAQNVLDLKIETLVHEKPLIEVLTDIENQEPVRFFFLEKWLEPYKVQPQQSGQSLGVVLNNLFKGSDIDFTLISDYGLVFFMDPSTDLKRRELLQSAEERKVKSRKTTIGEVTDYVPGMSVKLEGKVVTETGKLLPAAVIYLHESKSTFSSSERGIYSITLQPGEHILSFQALGYQEQMVDLAIYQDGELNIILNETPTTLEEVVIQDQAIKDVRVSFSSIKFSDIKRTPALLGEADVIKQIQMQSGVTTTSEASSGFSVRGGGMDQNLILYDGVPIFNSTHALGFLTAFNADAVSEAAFYKGAIPAEYGGRVSSVLSMASKEGSFDRWHGSLGLGALTSHVTVGGPVKKDTSSIIVSLRSSYSDWILNQIKTKFKSISDGSVFFWDGSVKYSQRFANNGRITFSGYVSGDKFSLANDTVNSWRNTALSLRYDKTVSPTLFYSVTGYLGNYSYTVEQEEPEVAFRLKYDVLYPGIKFDVSREAGIHKMTYGVHSNYYQFNPGTIKPISNESNVIPFRVPKERSIESALYFGDSFNWTERIQLELGLRISLYNRIGPGKLYKYDPDKPMEAGSEIDSVIYSGGQIMKAYIGPEPRLAFKYAMNTTSSIKIGYNRMYQYVHLISNTAVITPVDIWQTSNVYFKPQVADQVSAGYFISFKKGVYEASLEGYYKNLKYILDFRDGANLILNRQLETALLPGTGKSYGVEFTLRKNKGKLTGEINYTFSRSFRQVNGVFDLDKINKGELYPANTDLPHVLNLSWRKELARKIFFTGTFVYHTGRPVSLPLSAYEVDHTPISDFSERNNFRIPDYHRLDLALIFEGSNRKKKFGESYWTFSLYNVYSRKNPYSVFFIDKGGRLLMPRQLSLIGTVIPSITYGYKF